jgi:excisionase family DNA binding protein
MPPSWHGLRTRCFGSFARPRLLQHGNWDSAQRRPHIGEISACNCCRITPSLHPSGRPATSLRLMKSEAARRAPSRDPAACSSRAFGPLYGQLAGLGFGSVRTVLRQRGGQVHWADFWGCTKVGPAALDMKGPGTRHWNQPPDNIRGIYDCQEHTGRLAVGVLQATTAPARLAYSVSEVQELLGIGKTLMYDLLAQGKIGSIKAGRRTLITQAHLEAPPRRPAGASESAGTSASWCPVSADAAPHGHRPPVQVYVIHVRVWPLRCGLRSAGRAQCMHRAGKFSRP